ncbi:MAG: methyltransferase domain-containing protein [Humidesulfovibrio sp.]|nr:methyltransferase domain-containing protein [Humidesulfovibrio sp.]
MACADSPLTHAELVARRFGARAAQYDDHAQLQRVTAARLAAFIKGHGGPPAQGLVVEIGCGTGLLAAHLAGQACRYLATDIAPEVLERCRARLGHLPQISFAVLDGEGASFPQTPAAIVSNLAAQWFHDPVAGLAHLARQTSFFAFAVPLSGSFPEWEEAFRVLGRASGLLPLPDEAALNDALTTLSGHIAHFETTRHVIRYENARAFADSFRGIGADQPRPGYRPAPIRPVLQRFARGMDATARVLYGLITKETA